ncbi:hypothetical protein EV361DRAFT_998896, partial [Lentinula raphanica]
MKLPLISWSFANYCIILLWSLAASCLCWASNPATPNSIFSGSETLLNEFRIHYHHFGLILNQISQTETDPFHLELLNQDLQQFYSIVQQNPSAFSDPSEWQTLQINLQHMILDVQTIYNHSVEQSHRGRPQVMQWEHNGSAGRPHITIDPVFLRWAYTHRTTSGIADFLGVSTRTVRRALLYHGIASPGSNPFPNTRNLESSTSTAPVDPVLHPDLEIPDNLPPDIYNMANSIQSSSSSNGYSRLITALRASNNNRPQTVLSLFISA